MPSSRDRFLSRAGSGLARQKLVQLDVSSTPERIGPAAAALMQQVPARVLVHDRNAELARQIGRVAVKATPKGWSDSSGTGEIIVGAQGRCWPCSAR